MVRFRLSLNKPVLAISCKELWIIHSLVIYTLEYQNTLILFTFTNLQFCHCSFESGVSYFLLFVIVIEYVALPLQIDGVFNVWLLSQSDMTRYYMWLVILLLSYIITGVCVYINALFVYASVLHRLKI